MAETLEHQSDMYGGGSEDASSICEEERVRKLFQACDGDGDGYIDSQDLRSMCRELNLEHSLDELMRELGADEHGRVSFDEFLRCRLALRPEIDALRGGGVVVSGAAAPVTATTTTVSIPVVALRSDQPAAPTPAAPLAAPAASTAKHRATPEYLPTGSDHSLGAASGGKHESWEFDSGARDLSPEPHALQKLVEAAGGPLGVGGLGAGASSGMFELANKLHLAALTSLKGEILELSGRLNSVTQERDLLEEQLTKTQLEKRRLASESEQRLDLQSQRYEERITELHSVIAELRRTLDRQRSTAIQEEDDPSEIEEVHETADSTANLVEGSDVHETGSAVDETARAPAVEIPEESGNATTTKLCDPLGNCCEADLEAVVGHEAGTLTPPGSCCGKGDQQTDGANAKDEECEHLKRTGRDVSNAHHHRFRDRSAGVGGCSLAEELALACGSGSPATSSCHPDHARSRKVDSGSRINSPECCAGPRCASAGSLAVVPRDDMPVCKVAERVTLRKMDPQITGSQLASLGVSNTPVAESLVSELRAADAAELARGGELAARHEVEREQLSARLDHARAQNRVLALALEESRAQSERLALLVGKYESNATALRLALGFSDRAIEAYDVLVALLESELGLLLASCRTLGLASFGLHSTGNDIGIEGLDKASLLKQARDNRYAAETVARHVLARLETVVIGMPAAPWDDFSHAASEGEWGQVEEKRLRDHIVRLKTERAAVRGTVLELESCHVEPPGACVSLADACKLDLETAVLMQELMAVREERAELRARLFLLEKDKAAQELRLGAQELQLQQLQAQLQEIQLTSVQQWTATSDQEQGSQGEEASRREAKLRERMQGLVATLEKVSKNSEMRHQQSADLINDLKHANSALLQTLDRSKKKYQSRIKKLEQRMLDMAERHAHEVRSLKQRVADLESEVATAGRLAQNFGSSSLGLNAHSSTASETSL